MRAPRDDGAARGHPPGVKLSGGTAGVRGRDRPILPFSVAAGCLVLSGIAALTYQVTWVRLLGLSMGSTSASVGTVLAAFFLGMAIGSWLAGRFVGRQVNDLRAYMVLEVLIGVSGLALLPVLLNLDSMLAWMPDGGSSITVRFLVAVVLLCVPTVCLGATFPVMASVMIRRPGEMGLRMSQLYSLNTAGAALGALLSGFLFIPRWGLDGAVYIAVSLNLFIAFALGVLTRWTTLPPLEYDTERSDASESGRGSSLRVPALLLLFLTGFAAIATEVGWTKYLAILFGSTIYGFAAILTVFLVGIAAGAWAVRRHIESLRAPAAWSCSACRCC